MGARQKGRGPSYPRCTPPIPPVTKTPIPTRLATLIGGGGAGWRRSEEEEEEEEEEDEERGGRVLELGRLHDGGLLTGVCGSGGEDLATKEMINPCIIHLHDIFLVALQGVCGEGVPDRHRPGHGRRAVLARRHHVGKVAAGGFARGRPDPVPHTNASWWRQDALRRWSGGGGRLLERIHVPAEA